jgi:hypothetical protein
MCLLINPPDMRRPNEVGFDPFSQWKNNGGGSISSPPAPLQYFRSNLLLCLQFFAFLITDPRNEHLSPFEHNRASSSP